MAITAVDVDMVDAKRIPRRIRLRPLFIAMAMLMGPVSIAPPAAAQVSIGIAIPGASIGVYQPVYPDLVLVPGYPVYYAPQVRANYFFYDGFYWVFHEDRWYTSAWYDGPWDLVDPYAVPLFVLRVPVRYYVNPPRYFHGWLLAAPPRWDLHWGPRWAQHRHGWDHWDYRAVPRAAPPPVYQRHYSGARYPRREYQRELHEHYYRQQPREAHVQRQYAERPASQPQPQSHPAAPDRRAASRANDPQQARHEVRRYETAPPASQPVPQPRQTVVQEQRPPSRPEPERRAQYTSGPPNTPVMQSTREVTQHVAPVQVSPSLRSPQVFEQRPAARMDAGPREPQAHRGPQGRERDNPLRGQEPSRGHNERSRGHSQERAH